jgi:hypothetical protein
MSWFVLPKRMTQSNGHGRRTGMSRGNMDGGQQRRMRRLSGHRVGPGNALFRCGIALATQVTIGCHRARLARCSSRGRRTAVYELPCQRSSDRWGRNLRRRGCQSGMGKRGLSSGQTAATTNCEILRGRTGRESWGRIAQAIRKECSSSCS